MTWEIRHCERASCRRLASHKVPSKDTGIDIVVPRALCTEHAAEVARFILDRLENRELVWALEFYFKLSERDER